MATATGELYCFYSLVGVGCDQAQTKQTGPTADNSRAVSYVGESWLLLGGLWPRR